MEKKDVIKHVDRAKIAKYKRDLAKYCELINNTAEVLKRAELIEELTPDLCAQLVNQDIAPFKASIIKAFEDEAKKHDVLITRKEYKNRAGQMLTEVCKVFDMFMQDVRVSGMDLRLESWERVPFIKCVDGVAVFMESDITDSCTHKYNSRTELDFIERTKRLHAEMIMFNQDCKRMGGVGIGRTQLDLIEVSGEVDDIRINWEALENLNI